MKKLLALFLFIGTFLMISAQNYYDTQWKKIEQNYKQGLYKSNLPIILEIQTRASQDNNAVQLIKSLKAEFSIIKQTEDDTQNDSASKFFAKLQSVEGKLSGSDRLVFKVLLGDFFSDYYNNRAWTINQRTNISSQDLSQIETWSQLDFKHYLTKNFEELRREAAALRRIPLEQYREIFYSTDNLDYFPTLADWNAAREIEFLKNGQLFTPNELKANQNRINAVYDDAISKNAGNSKLYFEHQKLLYNCSVSNCKDRLEQLRRLLNSPADGDYKVLIAEDIVEELMNKDRFSEALILIDGLKKQYPKSKFLNNILNQQGRIMQPMVVLHYETETQSNKPIHLVAEHKNAQAFTLTIYQTEDIQGFLNHIRDGYRFKFSSVKKTLVRKENYMLENRKDYKTYKTSLEIKPLPPGIYLVEYAVENSVGSTFYFIASEHRVRDVLKNDTSGKDDIEKLVDRENGAPKGNTPITIYEFLNEKPVVKSSVKTDASGNFTLPKSDEREYYHYYLLRSSGNNYQLLNHFGKGAASQNDSKVSEGAQIFLDRAIYRPGQTVYFKTIATAFNPSTQKEKVLEKIKLTVVLKDANGEEVSKQTLTTNAFGSVNGSFTLPNGKLNGEFSINVFNEEQSGLAIDAIKPFRVEEYKRPKFEVTFEPIKGEYQYGQTLELKGKAMMFSGVPLSNATVNYEIKKRNIRWMYFRWYPRTNENENSILGSVKTNEKGEFTIKIDLKKDETLEGIQVDNYEINASVTDINGETQSAETNVKVSSVSHYIKADVVGNIFTDEDLKLNVAAKNYNDQDLQKSYHVKLSKLQEPERIFRENFQQEIQNLPQFSKQEFINKFPHDFFDKNDEMKNWKVEKVAFDKRQESRITNQEKPVADTQKLTNHNQQLDLGRIDAGTYRLELYNIEGKDTIKSEQYFKVWDKRFLKDNQKPFLEVVQPKGELGRNEKAKIYVYSAIKDAWVNVFAQNGNGETKTETLKMNSGLLVYDVPVPTDEKISMLNVQFQLVAFNDVQTKTVEVKIKDDKKVLKIETVTFRDKIEPNSKEKWTVRILDNPIAERKKNKEERTDADEQLKTNNLQPVVAEVLANMYDMSLDQFAANTYTWRPLFSRSYRIVGYDINRSLAQQFYTKRYNYAQQFGVMVPQFNWFDGGIYAGGLSNEEGIKIRGYATPSAPMRTMARNEATMVLADASTPSPNAEVPKITKQLETTSGIANEEGKKEDWQKISVRQNLNETAFFYPNLLTDKDGNVHFEFTSPEALTKWKLMFLAHTKDARSGSLEKEVVTQKEFSVTPNYPRFLREGDELNLQSKLSNLTTQRLKGSATLQILDAFTNQDISSKFNLNNTDQNFNLTGNGNAVANWKIKVPPGVSTVIFKIVAKAGDYSDGEQKAIPVLPNRMLVTDAQPIFVKEGQTKTFTLKNLAENNSSTATTVAHTLELTTNPVWEVLLALPSLKDDQNLSADVQFNKWLADVLASEIFKANPKLKTIFEEYQSKGLLTSNLEKNQELKQLLLEETPWLLESQNETEQMQAIARLFDANTMRQSIREDWEDLVKLQNPDGGFSWYPGYPSSYGTSLYLLKNLGRIQEWLKGNLSDYQGSAQKEMVQRLVRYIDGEVSKYWDVRRENVFNNFVLDYLDTRHYWEKQFPLGGKGLQLKNAVIKKAPTAKLTDYTFFGLHRAALLFDRYQLKSLSKKLLTYLKETGTQSETQGVYWKQNLNDWGWYSSKVVNHAGALEAFHKLAPSDTNFLEELKIWLITQKEVSSWDTSRSTAEVIFTILNSGKSWTTPESEKVTILWGGKNLEDPDQKATGYVKKSVHPDAIDRSLGHVTVTKPGPGMVQGGVFWQYYEDLDKIKSSETYISITKELYRKIKTENGEELQKMTTQTPLKVGDKVTVRMILNTDRNMEYIHLKDMRAAGFEPLNVLSGYRWNNSLGYYQSTKDASTNFYIEYMPKGRYVFEYDLVCNASGTFSGGITTLQNYYAPQMNAHTEGMRVSIGE